MDSTTVFAKSKEESCSWLSSAFTQVVPLSKEEKKATFTGYMPAASKVKVFIKLIRAEQTKEFEALKQGLQNHIALSEHHSVLPVIEQKVFNDEMTVAFAVPFGRTLDQRLEEASLQKCSAVEEVLGKLASGLQYAKRELNVAHDNIKASNVILHDDKYLWTDWYWSRTQDTPVDKRNRQLPDGSQDLASPERIELALRGTNKERFNFFQSDMYALGILGLKMLGCHQTLFLELRSSYMYNYDKELLFILTQNKILMSESSRQLANLLQRMLAKQPTDRLEVNQIAELESDTVKDKVLKEDVISTPSGTAENQ